MLTVLLARSMKNRACGRRRSGSCVRAVLGPDRGSNGRLPGSAGGTALEPAARRRDGSCCCCSMSRTRRWRSRRRRLWALTSAGSSSLSLSSLSERKRSSSICSICHRARSAMDGGLAASPLVSRSLRSDGLSYSVVMLKSFVGLGVPLVRSVSEPRWDAWPTRPLRSRLCNGVR